MPAKGTDIHKPLTKREEAFINALAIEGLTQRQAYKRAYNCENWKEESIDRKASETLKRVHVLARYNTLLTETQQKDREKAIFTRDELIADFKHVFKTNLDDFNKIAKIKKIDQGKNIMLGRSSAALQRVGNEIGKILGYHSENIVVDDKRKKESELDKRLAAMSLEELKEILND
ncbi:MAG: hypothetical protein FWC36_02845 [Spirochaetes bacterium]|nr:hypothetical protein [Spirochaetota bacterium]